MCEREAEVCVSRMAVQKKRELPAAKTASLKSQMSENPAEIMARQRECSKKKENVAECCQTGLRRPESYRVSASRAAWHKWPGSLYRKKRSKERHEKERI